MNRIIRIRIDLIMKILPILSAFEQDYQGQNQLILLILSAFN